MAINSVEDRRRTIDISPGRLQLYFLIYFYFEKIQEGRLLLQFRGGLYPESNANLYDERFIGGGINLRVGEYEWSSNICEPMFWSHPHGY